MKRLNSNDQTTQISADTVSSLDLNVDQCQETVDAETSSDEKNCFGATKVVSSSLTESAVKVTTGSIMEPILSGDDIRLQDLKNELQMLEDDSKNDANNYMRSKQEIKELKSQISKVRKQISILEAKMARQGSNKNQEVVDLDQIENDQEDDGLIFSLFDEDNAASDQLQTDNNSMESTGKILFPEDAIPLNWTGTTPMEYLVELCRKEKYSRPTIHKLPRNGCRLSVMCSNDCTISFEESGPYSNFNFVQHYLSLKVLYQMKRTLSLHRIFPPFYRDLWLSWQNDVKQRLQLQATQLEELRHKIIEELFEIACSFDASRRPENGNDVGSINHKLQKVANQAREPASGSSIFKPEKGAKLKEDFLLRVQSLRYQRFLLERKNLPIYNHREQILETIQSNAVTILCAETGTLRCLIPVQTIPYIF
jgi:hypothetical protein